MKKLIVGLLMAFLMGTGLVAATNTAANAADCPYEGCVDTTTVAVSAADNRRNRATFAVKVSAVGSNARPVGRVQLVVKKRGSTKIIYNKTKSYGSTAKIKFTAQGLKPANYVYAAVFYAGEADGFNSSVGKGSFQIK